jgi:hypothetical protein
VTVDKTSGVPLGAAMEHEDDDAMLRIRRLMRRGLFPLWNAISETPVKPNDCIVGVNGHRGSTDDLVAQLKQFQVLEIVIRREVLPSEKRARDASGPSAAAAGAASAPGPAALALSRTGQAFLAASRSRSAK